jgi:putative Mg2+ transporter-C (MgtC) family protein
MDILTWLGFEPMDTPLQVVLTRLGLSALLGAMIGFERGARTGTAGIRTHILISVAATLFTILAFEIYDRALRGGSNNPDPIRAIEAVTAGIAFLGAGAIFRGQGSVQGLTTGAGMWLAGAVGISVALGFYHVGILVALLAVIVLAVLRAFSHKVAARGDAADR